MTQSAQELLQADSPTTVTEEDAVTTSPADTAKDYFAFQYLKAYAQKTDSTRMTLRFDEPRTWSQQDLEAFKDICVQYLADRHLVSLPLIDAAQSYVAAAQMPSELTSGIFPPDVEIQNDRHLFSRWTELQELLAQQVQALSPELSADLSVLQLCSTDEKRLRHQFLLLQIFASLEMSESEQAQLVAFAARYADLPELFGHARSYSRTAMHVAAANGHIEAVRYLSEHPTVDFALPVREAAAHPAEAPIPEDIQSQFLNALENNADAAKRLLRSIPEDASHFVIFRAWEQLHDKLLAAVSEGLPDYALPTGLSETLGAFCSVIAYQSSPQALLRNCLRAAQPDAQRVFLAIYERTQPQAMNDFIHDTISSNVSFARMRSASRLALTSLLVEAGAKYVTDDVMLQFVNNNPPLKMADNFPELRACLDAQHWETSWKLYTQISEDDSLRAKILNSDLSAAFEDFQAARIRAESTSMLQRIADRLREANKNHRLRKHDSV